MKAVKRFNNNVVLCVDNNGNEVVAFGKGLGFHELPYEITDLSLIERSYYGIENRYLSMIKDLTPEALDISRYILDKCRQKLEGMINPNLIFTLADHIDFSIVRYRKKIDVYMPLYHDLENMHPKEFQIAETALKLINKIFRVKLSRDEIVGIAMNIINAELDTELNQGCRNMNKIIDDITGIIEGDFAVRINKASANYARYLNHMRFLFKRIGEKKESSEEDLRIYRELAQEYPQAKKCANNIADYLIREKGIKLAQEELIYLILHINRLYS